MDCVRPGVELVRAILAPSRELSTLDFPTFERPRKATSGSTGAGKWSTLVAAPTNFERTRTLQFRGFEWKLQLAKGSVKTQRALVLYVLIADREVLVSQIKSTSDYYAETDADSKEHAIGWQRDQEEHDDCGGNQQPGRSFDANGHSRQHR